MLTKQQAYRRRQAIKARFFDEMDALISEQTTADSLGVVSKLNAARRRLREVRTNKTPKEKT